MRLLEVSAGARGTLGSGLLCFDSLGRWDGRRTHVGAPFAKRRLGLGWRGWSESGPRAGGLLDRRIDTSLDWWRSLHGDGLLAILGVSLYLKESAEEPTLLGGELNFSMSSSIVMMGPGGGESAGGAKCLLGLSTSI